MKILRLSLYFLVGLLLGVVSVLSHAESIAASYTTTRGSAQTSVTAACQSSWSSAWVQINYAGYQWIFHDVNGMACRAKYVGTGGSYGTIQNFDNVVLSCPSGKNWTLDGTSCTRPDCVSPQVRQANGTCGAPACAAGTVAGSGLYDIGTSATGSLGKLYCNSGCEVMIGEGTSPVASAVVAGVTHYYGRARYDYTGETCTGGTGVPNGLAGPPTDTCAAGQGRATMNGKTICIDDAGNPVDTRAPTTTTGTKDTTTTTTNPDGTTTTTTSGTTENTTCTGDRCTTTTTTTGGGSGGGSGGTTTTTTSESRDSYCQKNPTSAQCTGGSSGATTDDDETETDPGSAAGTDGLYTKGNRTAAQAFNDFGNKARSAGFFSAASQFFQVSVPSGSCSDLSLSVDVGWGASYSFDMTPVFCGSLSSQVFGLLGIGVMLAAVWVAFKIAFL